MRALHLAQHKSASIRAACFVPRTSPPSARILGPGWGVIVGAADADQVGTHQGRHPPPHWVSNASAPVSVAVFLAPWCLVSSCPLPPSVSPSFSPFPFYPFSYFFSFFVGGLGEEGRGLSRASFFFVPPSLSPCPCPFPFPFLWYVLTKRRARVQAVPDRRGERHHRRVVTAPQGSHGGRDVRGILTCDLVP